MNFFRRLKVAYCCLVGRIICVEQTGCKPYTGKVDHLKHTLEVTFHPPKLMDIGFGFVFLYGPEEKVVVKGTSVQVLEAFAKNQRYREHSRFKSLAIE